MACCARSQPDVSFGDGYVPHEVAKREHPFRGAIRSAPRNAVSDAPSSLPNVLKCFMNPSISAVHRFLAFPALPRGCGSAEARSLKLGWSSRIRVETHFWKTNLPRKPKPTRSGRETTFAEASFRCCASNGTGGGEARGNHPLNFENEPERFSCVWLAAASAIYSSTNSESGTGLPSFWSRSIAR